MSKKVKVTADAAGNVIVRSSNNPEYGHIRVEQVKMMLDDNGFARKKKLSALIPGTVEDLAFFEWSANQEVEGTIIVKESLEPFNTRNPERDYKVAGQSGIICKMDDYPIHRKNFYVLDATAQDSLIEHTNTEEIQAAYKLDKEEKNLEVTIKGFEDI